MASSTDRRPARIFGLAALLLTAALALPATASVLHGLTVKQLRSGSDAIVTGRVVAVRTVNDGRTIETVARVRVADVHKGEPGRTVTVRVPGGIADGQRLVVPGSPSLRRGDDVILFLYRAENVWRPVGLFQGVWTIDAEDPSAAIASDSGGAALLRNARTLAVDRSRRDVAQLVGGAR